MHRHWSIVVNDQTVLSDLFGANDQNIRVFEELLGVRVLARGNEIFLETDNDDKRRVFKTILSECEDQVKSGRSLNPALIRAIHSSVRGGENITVDFFKKNAVTIPNGITRVFPRSQNQAVYLESIDNNDMVFGIGPAGTGKTFLAVAEALRTVLNRKVRRLVITRPVIEAGESLGYLPGDLESKISPYLKPLYDAMEILLPVEIIKKMEENGKLEIAPLAYMRGRTLSDAFVILDEAQNTTREQMKMFLTRIGENSKTVITGDITQIDLPKSKSSGLLHVMSILNMIKEIKFIFFNETDVVRNKLVRKIVHAYETTKEK
ncbi:MAG: PhoH family protein [Spirochaetes bacterium]|nr:PhoH family protein [Spirochaetota bacterium]